MRRSLLRMNARSISPSVRPRQQGRLGAAFALWGLACAAGSAALGWYGLQAGPPAAGIVGRPAVLGVPDDTTSAPELVVVAHPRCPCTRASLRELQRLLVQAPEDLAVRVLLFVPDGSDADHARSFSEGAVADLAQRLPGARLQHDPGGRLAAALGATTSGHCVLFDADGTTLFAGGVTAMRGHEGPSAGSAALRAAFRGDQAAPTATPTFGCSLASLP